MTKKLTRSSEKKIAGVCGGMAEYLNVDPTVVRIIWLCMVLFAGCGFFAYLICWLLMPEHDNFTPRASENLLTERQCGKKGLTAGKFV